MKMTEKYAKNNVRWPVFRVETVQSKNMTCWWFSQKCEGVIEIVDINIDGFTFFIKVVVLEMKGLDRVQMILGRPLLATSRAILS